MRRRAIAVCGLFAAGCLVPNPMWSGADNEASSGATTTGPTTNATLSGGTSMDATSNSSSSTAGGPETGSETGDIIPTSDFCPEALDAPETAIVVPAGAGAGVIQDAIMEAGPGGTVALEPGTYTVGDRTVVLDQPNLVFRSTTGDPKDVSFDAAGGTADMLHVAASGVRVAGIGFERSRETAIRVGGGSDGNIAGTVLFRLDFHDVRLGIESMIGPAPGDYADEGVIACSSFRRSAAARMGPECESASAIVLYSAVGWVVRDNTISDYFCDEIDTTSVSVRFAEGSRGTVVERNRFDNVFRGVMFGGEDPAMVVEPFRSYDDSPCEDTYWGHIGGVIRNNLFWNGSTELQNSGAEPNNRTDSAISFWTVCQGAAYHNTVISILSDPEIFGSIEYRWPGTTVSIVNNLVTDEIMARQGATLVLGAGNMEFANANEVIDPVAGDLHLAPTSNAIGGGVPLDEVEDDYEGTLRGRPPDIGAIEFSK